MVNHIVSLRYHFTDFQNDLMIGLIFLGFNIGSISSGRISDNYGRKMPFYFAAILANFIGYLSMIFNNFIGITTTRVLQASLVGFFGPLGFTLLAEITPKSLRGRCMAICSASVSFGQLYGYLIGYLVL